MFGAARIRLKPSSAPGAASARVYELRPAGFLLIFVSVFLAIGAINSQNNLLFWLFGLAIGGVLISGVLSGSAMLGIRLERDMPAVARAGEPAIITYRLRNTNRRVPAMALALKELSGGELTGTDSKTPDAALFHLAAGQRASVRLAITPARRGVHTLGDVHASSDFPFGLIRKAVIFTRPATVIVRPARVPLGAAVDRALPAPDFAGNTSSSTRGGQADFHALREYVSGDSVRSFAWKRTAALDRPIVREHAAAMPPRSLIELDLTPPAPGSDTRLAAERAIALAASVFERAVERGYRVGLRVPAADIEIQPAGGRAHADRAADALALIDLDALHQTPPPEPRLRNRVLISSRTATGSASLNPGVIETYLPRGATLPEPLIALAPSTAPRLRIRAIITAAVRAIGVHP